MNSLAMKHFAAFLHAALCCALLAPCVHAAGQGDKTEPNMGRLGALIVPRVQFEEATLVEAVDYLTFMSQKLDPEKAGITILADEATRASQAKITFTAEKCPLSDLIQYVAIQARLEASLIDDAVRLKKAASDRPQVRARPPSPRVERLSALVIPRLSFNGATMSEAAAFLSQQCPQIDPASDRLPVILDPELVDQDTPRITLQLTNTTVLKALRFAAELANAEVVCLGEAYYVLPKGK
jgi:hypothetical protein